MESEAILDFLVYNGEIYPTKKINPLKEMKNPSIYEVIRIIDGIPLYLEEHLTRLRKSAELLNVKLNKSDYDITRYIHKLIDSNIEYNLNVKILCNNFENDCMDIYVYFIKSFYPLKFMYEEGIHTIFYETERENPNAKVSNKHLRKRITEKREKENAFEALLVNKNRQITEGSRSNVFFVKDDKIYTPPAEKILLGVTRNKILDLCKINSIEIVEKDIFVDKIVEYDGAFITGTSVNVLPIKTINNIKLKSTQNGIILKLMEIYEEDKKSYINKRKNNKGDDL